MKVLAPLSDRCLSEKFTFVMNRLDALGVRPNPSTRLSLEQRWFRNSEMEWKGVQFRDPRFWDAVEAGRDVLQFEMITSLWPFEPGDHYAKAKLRLAMKDTVDSYANAKCR